MPWVRAMLSTGVTPQKIGIGSGTAGSGYFTIVLVSKLPGQPWMGWMLGHTGLLLSPTILPDESSYVWLDL